MADYTFVDTQLLKDYQILPQVEPSESKVSKPIEVPTSPPMNYSVITSTTLSQKSDVISSNNQYSEENMNNTSATTGRRNTSESPNIPIQELTKEASISQAQLTFLSTTKLPDQQENSTFTVKRGFFNENDVSILCTSRNNYSFTAAK
uniref:Uncharacterized protein n=1 Tax=Heterorhabditis bacteriophora TaxID=37862 RepID=A0A1I7X3N2_HETBA